MSVTYRNRYEALTIEETRSEIERRLHVSSTQTAEALFDALADVGEFNRAYPSRKINRLNPLRVTVTSKLPEWPR